MKVNNDDNHDNEEHNNDDANFNKLQCAPGKENKPYTCYKTETLIIMRDNWNSRHPDLKIETEDPMEIWENLKINMEDVCSNESCWLRQKFMENSDNNELLSYTFAPKSPKTWLKNPNEWLSSLDIERVMKQYEKEYKNFDFIGPSPIDFDTHMLNNECVWEELCKFTLKKHLRRGKQKIGIIFNTDPHYKDGSHWISLFINIQKNNNYIFFFDSNGDKAPKEIKKLCERILQEGIEELGIENFKFYENSKSHQRSNTECGMYSLYLIIELLTENHTIEHFMNTWIKDVTVESFRKKYFN